MKNIPTFEEFLNESVNTTRQILDFVEKIYDNGFDKIEISPKFTKIANDVFKSPKFSKHGKQTSKTTYEFSNEDVFAEFVKDLADYVDTNDLKLMWVNFNRN